MGREATRAVSENLCTLEGNQDISQCFFSVSPQEKANTLRGGETKGMDFP